MSTASRGRRWLPPVLLGAWCVVACAVALRAQADHNDGPTVPKLTDVDSDLLRLVVDDQWDRGMDMFGGRQVKAPDAIDWAAVTARDERRQAAVRTMLAEGRIRTPRDQHFAALIFQHSSRPEHLALAHVLASTSAAGGHAPARWLAAASFDRLLRSLNRPQVFGTQFSSDDASGWTMEPYDREAVSNHLRAEWCVVPLNEQERILRDLRAGRPVSPSTSVSDCGKRAP